MALVLQPVDRPPTARNVVRVGLDLQLQQPGGSSAVSRWSMSVTRAASPSGISCMAMFFAAGQPQGMSFSTRNSQTSARMRADHAPARVRRRRR